MGAYGQQELTIGGPARIDRPGPKGKLGLSGDQARARGAYAVAETPNYVDSQSPAEHHCSRCSGWRRPSEGGRSWTSELRASCRSVLRLQ
jgi:hypothetical protein